jgi:hypothetical protein
MWKTITYLVLCLIFGYMAYTFKDKAWIKNYYSFVEPVAEKNSSNGKYNRTSFYVEFIDLKTNENIVKEVDYNCYFNGREKDIYSFKEQAENFLPYFFAALLSSALTFVLLICFILRLTVKLDFNEK